MDTSNLPDQITWEEAASTLPRSASNTQRLMAAIYFRFRVEGKDTSDVAAIEKEYFSRARWPRTTNLAATANYCAGRGWLTVVGIQERRKHWRITRKGSDNVEEYLHIN